MSRPMAGFLLAPCHDQFREPRSDYIRQSDYDNISALLHSFPLLKEFVPNHTVGGSSRRRILWVDAFSRRRLKEMAFVEQIMNIKFCVHLGKSVTDTHGILRCKAVIHYRELKLLSGTDVSVSEKAGKVSKRTHALNVHSAENIKKVSALSNIVLQWVPFHCDIYENEEADLLSKNGSDSLQLFQRGMPYYSIRRIIKTNVKKIHATYSNERICDKSWRDTFNEIQDNPVALFRWITYIKDVKLKV
ncbi:hypothetical protein TNCV_2040671 [Trichonephila clavipes]|nr:hypothetical protein TNCV_2040671 [Trichonephila clavipes]